MYTHIYLCVLFLHWVVPEAVLDLDASITHEDIIITWMVGPFQYTCMYAMVIPWTILSQPPPPSSRPPVTGYKISHNNTGNDTVSTISDTEYVVIFTGPGVYLFTVQAYNVLGDGNESNILVTG